MPSAGTKQRTGIVLFNNSRERLLPTPFASSHWLHPPHLLHHRIRYQSPRTGNDFVPSIGFPFFFWIFRCNFCWFFRVFGDLILVGFWSELLMADAASRYVKLTKEQDAPTEEIRPGELNQPVEVPQVIYLFIYLFWLFVLDLLILTIRWWIWYAHYTCLLILIEGWSEKTWQILRGRERYTNSMIN